MSSTGRSESHPFRVTVDNPHRQQIEARKPATSPPTTEDRDPVRADLDRPRGGREGVDRASDREDNEDRAEQEDPVTLGRCGSARRGPVVQDESRV